MMVMKLSILVCAEKLES